MWMGSRYITIMEQPRSHKVVDVVVFLGPWGAVCSLLRKSLLLLNLGFLLLLWDVSNKSAQFCWGLSYVRYAAACLLCIKHYTWMQSGLWTTERWNIQVKVSKIIQKDQYMNFWGKTFSVCRSVLCGTHFLRTLHLISFTPWHVCC